MSTEIPLLADLLQRWQAAGTEAELDAVGDEIMRHYGQEFDAVINAKRAPFLNLVDGRRDDAEVPLGLAAFSGTAKASGAADPGPEFGYLTEKELAQSRRLRDESRRA